MMIVSSIFEMLPDEMILQVCSYLRGVDVLYSFFNLNARLNVTIAGYCGYVNLMAVSHQQFDYVVSCILPKIGASVRFFVIHGSWETIMSSEAFAVLFTSQTSLIFPLLQRLTLRWFTVERLLSFIDNLQNLSQLIELDIRGLKGITQDILLKKVLTANDSRLEIVLFDQGSADLNVSEDDETVSYPNIQELMINVVSNQMLIHLFKLVPNVRRLCVHLDEVSDSPKPKQELINLSSLVHLIDFELRSINLFWTFDEITSLLQHMPSLQRLALDLRTDDQRLVNRKNLVVVLPLSVTQIYFYIRYHFSKQNYELSTLVASWPDHMPITYLLDKEWDRLLFHTIPYGLRSVSLPATIGKQMLPGWKYMQQAEDLFLYNATSTIEILSVLQHFRRLRTLSIDMRSESEIVTTTSVIEPIAIKLPWLKKLEVSGICELFHLLNAAPNLERLIINIDCLTVLLENEPTCNLLQQRIVRLHVLDWSDTESDLLQRTALVFSSLQELALTMKDAKVIIDPIVLKVLALWHGKQLFSLYISGQPSQEASKNFRQWLIDHTHLTAKDSFSIEYHDNWFDLWL